MWEIAFAVHSFEGMQEKLTYAKKSIRSLFHNHLI